MSMVHDRAWCLMIVYPLASLREGCIDSFVGNACVFSVKWDGGTSKDVVGMVKQAGEWRSARAMILIESYKLSPEKRLCAPRENVFKKKRKRLFNGKTEQ